MGDYHESVEFLDEKTRNMTRVLNSLKEEIEAVDWYNQRAAATNDEDLKAILEHNRDEEIEHACMALEWLRRNMSAWDEELSTYLFTEGPIAHIEEGAEEDSEGKEGDSDSKLEIGDLKQLINKKK